MGPLIFAGQDNRAAAALRGGVDESLQSSALILAGARSKAPFRKCRYIT